MSEPEKEGGKDEPPKEWESYLRKFLAAVPPIDQSTLSSADQTLSYLKELAQRVPEQIASTIKTMIELLQELTNVKGVEVQLKSLRILDIKMHLLRKAEIPLKRDIIGIGKIEALELSKLIHFQAEIGEGNRDIRMHIHEGLALIVSIAFIAGRQVLPLKGTAKLVRDAKGQINVESTSYVPGTDMPVTVSFPLNQIIDEVSKQFSGR
jgi:hypothetical protein